LVTAKLCFGRKGLKGGMAEDFSGIEPSFVIRIAMGCNIVPVSPLRFHLTGDILWCNLEGPIICQKKSEICAIVKEDRFFFGIQRIRGDTL
jgi:hypothetical protein